MKIVLEHLTKRYPNRNKKIKEEVVAVSDFTFEIPDGKLIGLLGPSGCGKSTTLNMICGLEKPTEGKIYFGEDDVTELPPEKRGVGMVFQSYALYPHLTARQNIMFPLENRKGKDKMTKEEMVAKAEEAARLVQIERLLDRKPSEMAGGQQQRGAIARALAHAPVSLLADEATGNLDTCTSYEIMSLFQDLHEQGKTIAFVTHEPDIATFTTRKIKLRDGQIIEDAPINTQSAAEALAALNLQKED